MKNTVFWDITPNSLVGSLLVLTRNILPPTFRADMYPGKEHTIIVVDVVAVMVVAAAVVATAAAVIFYNVF